MGSVNKRSWQFLFLLQIVKKIQKISETSVK